MIGDVKMQTIKRRTGRSLTGDRPLFLALLFKIQLFVVSIQKGFFYAITDGSLMCGLIGGKFDIYILCSRVTAKEDCRL